eukprot:scaffold1803_cov92-Amphora_coffeaeformis.AAC.92
MTGPKVTVAKEEHDTSLDLLGIGCDDASLRDGLSTPHSTTFWRDDDEEETSHFFFVRQQQQKRRRSGVVENGSPGHLEDARRKQRHCV